MLGAICGDVIGRPYEFEFPTRTKNFDLFRHDSRFSDDTVLTAAVAYTLMHGGSYEEALVEFGMRHIEDGFGKGFKAWLLDENRQQGDSFGNGSAMRVSPVAWFAKNLDEAVEMARDSALPSHSHPEGIKGAIAVAAAVRLSIEGRFGEIRDIVTALTGYDLTRSVDEIRRTVPRFKTTCQESVADAIVCALEATDFEDGIRNAVSLGNDADTQASIAGAILEPRFGVPFDIRTRCVKTLSPDIASVFEDFEDRTVHFRRPDGTSLLAGVTYA
ncbi:ADP-ribosylglycohydrolase family protein [Agrobacterium rubi]|nr:ADP-ribosylglycohydrolase family protein [Agrobacterium rubi]NTF23810.1 ADP-ribosylglycohydrolase family protein [Agrobacterium rubi]